MKGIVAAAGAAVVALAIGAAVASGAVSFSSAAPVPPTAVAAPVVATPTVDLSAAAVQLQTDESMYCQCGK